MSVMTGGATTAMQAGEYRQAATRDGTSGSQCSQRTTRECARRSTERCRCRTGTGRRLSRGRREVSPGVRRSAWVAWSRTERVFAATMLVTPSALGTPR